jgi:diguanylate cyclase (GGDEF)-like protein
MQDDIRYSEFKFLRAVEKRDPQFEYIHVNPQQWNILGLHQQSYIEMLIAVAEDGCIQIENDILQLLVGRLRGEIAYDCPLPSNIPPYAWQNPRAAIHARFIETNQALRVRITYRGMCRVEELREILKRDRILDPFKVLLDKRYFHRDLEDALHKSPEIPVSLICLDLDGFKYVNDTFGHPAGDVVLTSYLEAVRDCIGSLGEGYRAGGDEVVALIVGQGHERVTQLAEKMRNDLANMKCKFKEVALPGVTASIGVATSPPEKRSMDLAEIADARQIVAKKQKGKNFVFAG